jgi:glucosamine-6-phosphate deaminase
MFGNPLFCIICALEVRPNSLDFKMRIRIFSDKATLARAAAEQAASSIREAFSNRGRARIVVATGASQFDLLDALTNIRDIDWARVEAFHLDEYVGLPMTHPGSFRRMLLERLVRKTGITQYHLVDGDASDPLIAIRESSQQISAAPIDLAFIGIGENGHIAFNDPPADFKTEDPYLLVSLDERCREQQVGEGWFSALADVPKQAISMSPRQILKAREIIAVVPESRKAQAVKASLEGEISPKVPASILRRHPNLTLYLDDASAALLSPAVRDSQTRDFELAVTS